MAESAHEAGVPSPPVPGLRDRKKAAAMHHIQETALGLFRERGFDRVTVEEVAAAAEVSPSTIYRYFGTKEGLVLHDEHDDVLFAALAHFLDQGLSPLDASLAALSQIEHRHFVEESASTLERVRLWFDFPSVRAAGYLTIDETVDDLARLMARTGRWSFAQSRLMAAALVWPMVSALRNWHEEGGTWQEHLHAMLDSLRELDPGRERGDRAR